MSRVITTPPEDSSAANGVRTGRLVARCRRRPAAAVPTLSRAAACSALDERGFCFVRENRDGRMVSTTYGRSTGFCVDPIEKKPLNHFYPGTSVLSFGTAGCNLGCKFCQNWSTSKSRDVEAACEAAAPEAIAEAAVRLRLPQRGLHLQRPHRLGRVRHRHRPRVPPSGHQDRGRHLRLHDAGGPRGRSTNTSTPPTST